MSPELEEFSKDPIRARRIRKHPDLLAELYALTSYLDESAPISERFYNLENGPVEKCPDGNVKEWQPHYGKYFFCGKAGHCSCLDKVRSKKISESKKAFTDVQKKNVIERRKKTNLEKYGAEFAQQTEQVKQKIKDTCIDRYGVDSTLKVPEIRQKQKDTHFARTGYDHPLKNPEIREQIKKTCIEKYGSEYAFFMDREKFKTIMMERHGVEHALQHPDFMNKRNETTKERYGTSDHMSVPEIRQKQIDTYVSKYGVRSSKQIGYTEEDYRIYDSKEEFLKEFDSIGLGGILQNFNLSRGVVRSCMIKFDIPRLLNLNTIEEIVYTELLEHFDETEIAVRNRKIIKPRELDIVVEDSKIAFEICGLYWHSDKNQKDDNYHFSKYSDCKTAGYRLFTIFEDEIIFDTYKLYKLIESLCSPSLPADIRTTNELEAQEFLESRLLGRYSLSENYLGWYIGDDLKAVASYEEHETGKLITALFSEIGYELLDDISGTIHIAVDNRFPVELEGFTETFNFGPESYNVDTHSHMRETAEFEQSYEYSSAKIYDCGVTVWSRTQ